jgi:AbrB family transcriptional regulator (stage V sporulation protein T)
MKATGIVRRIDDLGRVVIPKEIRRTMRIREGDPLDIYTDREGEVIFKKYSPIGELTNFAAQYAETLHKVCTMDVIICDRDTCIACAGVSKREYLEKALSAEFEHLMDNRSIFVYRDGDEKMMPINDSLAHYVSCAMPIVSSGDVIGIVASLKSVDGYGKSNLSAEVENRLISTAAGFLGRQLEE